MIATGVSRILKHEAPGQLRAVAIDETGRPYRLFTERWAGLGAPVRFGTVAEGRLRAFADDLRGAFCTLENGEEVFLRLKSREGLTEGARICVKIQSEARREKRARVVLASPETQQMSAYQLWWRSLPNAQNIETLEDRDAVEAAFEDATSRTVTLEGGGRLIVELTQALTAFDIDTAGRQGKGSAGARALSLNRVAAIEMARQMSLRGLGGNAVLDCIAPMNSDAGDRVRKAAVQAFMAVGTEQAKVLKPSALGLLEASIPWRYRPLNEELNDDASESHLLTMFRGVQREAEARPAKLFELSLGAETWRAYCARKRESDAALARFFGGRVTVRQSGQEASEILTR